MIYGGAGTVAMTKDQEYIFNMNVITEEPEITDNEDGSRTYTYTIKEDLKWSNGEPITAKDYVFGGLFLGSPLVSTDLEAGNAISEVQYIDGIDEYMAGETDTLKGLHLISDYSFSYTVRADKLPYFYGRVLAGVGPMYMKGWVPEDVEIIETEDGVKFNDAFTAENVKDTVEKERWTPTASDGAYMFVSYDESAYSYTLEVNPYYIGDYQGQTAQIQTVILKYAPQDTMMDEIKTGSIDYLEMLADGKDIDAGLDLVEAGTHDYISYSRDGYGQLIFKCNIGPTQFVEVRHAIAYLLDRNEFAKTFTGGHGNVVNGQYGNSQWMVEDAADELAQLNSYSYSKEEAIKELEAGGWTLDKDGNAYSGTGLRYKEVNGELMPLSIKWCSSENNSVSDLLVTMLAKNPDVEAAGMEINQNVVTFTELLDAYYFDKDDYNMFNMGEGFSVPFDIAEQWEIGGSYNYNRIEDEQLATLAKNLNLVEEGNDEEYLAIWVEFQKRFNELLPNVPLYSNEYHDVFLTKVKGVEGKNAIWDLSKQIVYMWIEE
jgi:peptide/nickel transport system substrate-binding protein